jgi:hypothetical protein
VTFLIDILYIDALTCANFEALTCIFELIKSEVSKRKRNSIILTCTRAFCFGFGMSRISDVG